MAQERHECNREMANAVMKYRPFSPQELDRHANCDTASL